MATNCPRCSAPIVPGARECSGKGSKPICKNRPRCSWVFGDGQMLIKKQARDWADVFAQPLPFNWKVFQAAYSHEVVAQLPDGQDNSSLIDHLLRTNDIETHAVEANIVGCNFDRSDCKTIPELEKARKSALLLTTIVQCSGSRSLYAMVEPSDLLRRVPKMPWYSFFGIFVPLESIMATKLNTDFYVPFSSLRDFGLHDELALVMEKLFPTVVPVAPFSRGVKVEPAEEQEEPSCRYQLRSKVTFAQEALCLVCHKAACGDRCKALRDEDVQDLLRAAQEWVSKHERVQQTNWLDTMQEELKQKDCVELGTDNGELFARLPKTLTFQQSMRRILQFRRDQRTSHESKPYNKVLLFSTLEWDGVSYGLVQMPKAFAEPPFNLDVYSFFGFPVPLREIDQYLVDDMFFLPADELKKLGLTPFIERVMSVRYPVPFVIDDSDSDAEKPDEVAVKMVIEPEVKPEVLPEVLPELVPEIKPQLAPQPPPQPESKSPKQPFVRSIDVNSTPPPRQAHAAHPQPPPPPRARTRTIADRTVKAPCRPPMFGDEELHQVDYDGKPATQSGVKRKKTDKDSILDQLKRKCEAAHDEYVNAKAEYLAAQRKHRGNFYPNF